MALRRRFRVRCASHEDGEQQQKLDAGCSSKQENRANRGGGWIGALKRHKCPRLDGAEGALRQDCGPSSIPHRPASAKAKER